MSTKIIGEQSEDTYLFANTMLFTENICQIIADMTGNMFTLRQETLSKDPFQTPHSFLIFTSFFGKITGKYVVSVNDIAALKIAGLYREGMTDEGIREERRQVSGLLKEILNIAVGQSIVKLEKIFGNLVFLSPTVVYGEVEFPTIITGQMEAHGEAGTILCACCLNLANLRIGRKLEEAQKKLNRVSESQSAMLMQPEELPNARFCVLYKSLDEAGGDIYDVFEISDDVYAYFVGDVSGHDIGIGFITASIKALLRQNCTAEYSPLESMRNINNVLCDLFSSYEYVTACYVSINRKTGYFSVINMGHPPIFFIPQRGEPELLNSDGDVLGAFKDCTFQAIERNVSPGDRCVIYTDGLVEINSKTMWAQEVSKLLPYAAKLKNVPFNAMADDLYKSIFSDKLRPNDDVVILGIEV